MLAKPSIARAFREAAVGNYFFRKLPGGDIHQSKVSQPSSDVSTTSGGRQTGTGRSPQGGCGFRFYLEAISIQVVN
jgi:hypothetical protein